MWRTSGKVDNARRKMLPENLVRDDTAACCQTVCKESEWNMLAGSGLSEVKRGWDKLFHSPDAGMAWERTSNTEHFLSVNTQHYDEEQK